MLEQFYMAVLSKFWLLYFKETHAERLIQLIATLALFLLLLCQNL